MLREKQFKVTLYNLATYQSSLKGKNRIFNTKGIWKAFIRRLFLAMLQSVWLWTRKGGDNTFGKRGSQPAERWHEVPASQPQGGAAESIEIRKMDAVRSERPPGKKDEKQNRKVQWRMWKTSWQCIRGRKWGLAGWTSRSAQESHHLISGKLQRGMIGSTRRAVKVRVSLWH